MVWPRDPVYCMIEGNTSIDTLSGKLQRGSLGARPFSRKLRACGSRMPINCERCGVGVVAGGAARCPSSEAEMYGCNTQGTAQVSALGSSEASAPQRFKCISIMGDSNGGSTTVRSRGGVLSREGPFSEAPLYLGNV